MEGTGLPDDDDVGPRTELVWWRRRAIKLNSMVDALKSLDAQKVLYGLGSVKHRSLPLKKWKLINNAITDALNDAKDIVKYLSTVRVGGGRPHYCMLLHAAPRVLATFAHHDVPLPTPRRVRHSFGRSGRCMHVHA